MTEFDHHHGTLNPPQPFDHQAVEVLGHLRAALASVIADLPGGVRRAADLQRAVSIDRKLSWRVFKVVQAADPLASGAFVPGPSNMRTFLKAAARAGVRDDLISAVATASSDFEQLVAAHAQDRSTFDSMVSGLAHGGNADHANLHHRRAAFRANRHLWGVQAAIQVKISFTDFGDEPTKVNVALVDGLIDLCQLRRDAPLIISCTRVSNDQGAALPIRREPIDRRAPSQHGLALLPDFCSQPPPEFREVPASAGFVYGELVSAGLGNGAALTCFTGWRAQNAASRYRAPNNTYAITHGAVRIPCEALMICQFTRAGMFGAAAPELTVYSDHMAQLPYPVHTHPLNHLLLEDESVAYLGRGPAAISTPDVPCLGELAQFVFDRLGWDGSQFDAYRCRIAYPLVPSTAALRVELPPASS